MKNKLIIATLVSTLISIPGYAKNRKEAGSPTKEVVVGLTLLFCPMCIVPVLEKLNEVKDDQTVKPKTIDRSLASDKVKPKK